MTKGPSPLALAHPPLPCRRPQDSFRSGTIPQTSLFSYRQ